MSDMIGIDSQRMMPVQGEISFFNEPRATKLPLAHGMQPFQAIGNDLNHTTPMDKIIFALKGLHIPA
jgi:hypothetical protein